MVRIDRNVNGLGISANQIRTDEANLDQAIILPILIPIEKGRNRRIKFCVNFVPIFLSQNSC